MKKKFLALMLVTSMLLSSTSVTAREIAPTVGGGTTKATNEQETPPTVKKTPTMPSTTEALKEETTEKSVDTTTSDTTSPTTETKTDAKPVPSVDVTEKADENIKETELNFVDETEKMTKELLIKADKKSEIPKDGKILSSYEDTYLVSFPNTDTAKEVYEDKNTDASLNIPFGIATGSDKASTVVEPDVLNNLEETLKADDTKGFTITDDDYSIAVIDTGMPKSSKNVEFISMLDDKGYDDHGHGTMILESIRKQNADAKILSIKALDKNGYGDAATIYAAIKYAIERNVDVINLSISGFATEGNKIIEDVIKDAISKGIVVIGAAGNDNLPASAFVPGGIDEAIIVGACNEKNERKLFSNYGITVDYYADAGSTSEASAIVSGTLSANNGNIKALDDTFFKTPDLSIFEEDLKKYRMPSANTNTVNDDDDGDTSIGDTSDDGIYKPLTDEEYLLLQLRRYVNEGGFHVAGNATINKTDNMQKAIKDAYANYTSYAVDKTLIPDATKITVSGTKWSREDNKEMLIDGNNSKFTGSWVVYDLGKDVSSAKDESVAADCTITIPGCVRCLNDNSIHDWIIKITDAKFLWGAAHPNANQPSEPSATKKTRQWLVAMQLVNKDLPKFTTGARSGTGYTAVDSANQFWFEMSVSGAPAGSVLLTGFADLDQWQPWPLGQRRRDGDGNFIMENKDYVKLRQPEDQTTSNSFDERISILDTSKMPTNNIWFDTNSHLVKGNYPNDDGSGINIHSTQFVQPDNKSWDNGDKEAKTVFAVKANAAESTPLYWNGCRCQTKVGLTMRNTISPSTFQTFVTYETTTPNVYGTYSTTSPDTTNPWTLLEDSVASKYPGEAYSYTYTGAGVDTSIWDTSKTFADPNTTAPYWTPYSIGYTATKDNKDFHLYVPRIRYTYKFDLNKPANATSNPTGQPSDITKPAGSQCGDYNATPSLKGWTFLGFYTDRTGGTKYVSTEEMWSDKTFYAHWEPMKYYVQYDGNGSTNFNENATNGMQAGEYTQNVVTGSTAYQIFTYDAAGEALRANGFTRRGYDYVCWNTTAIRTGTDLNPGYVKPANVNWIKGDNTDTPTATLDGTHTYPVVTLYAVWQQKPGTETLKVISEETGNPVSGVSLKLTNTYNNTQISTGTTGADGTVTVSNLHWFPYKWESTAVPAGYKNMQDVTFSINPANTSDESFLTVNNERILYMKHVKLTINSIVDDIIKDENAPSFMYHVTGKDVAGVAHSYDVMVQTSTGTKKGTNIVPVNSGSEEPYMFAGNYTVTQYDVSRYKPKNAINVSHTTPLGANANVNLTDYTSAEVTFPYGIDQYGGFSGVHSLINKLLK